MAHEASNNDISVLVMAVERLAEAQSKTNDKVDKLIESMGKQEVILEKLANIEKQHADSNKRVHNRIDEAVAESKARHRALDDKYARIEGYMLHDGCPAHKSFLIGDTMVKDRLNNSITRIQADLEELKDKKADRTDIGSINTRVINIEQAPNVALKKIFNSIIAVLGAGIGGWLVYKLGFEVK